MNKELLTVTEAEATAKTPVDAVQTQTASVEAVLDASKIKEQTTSLKPKRLTRVMHAVNMSEW